MTARPNPHFETVPTWEEAGALLSFRPRRLPDRPEYPLRSLSVYVRDHRHREVPAQERTLEAHYGPFVFTQSRKGEQEARRCAVEVSYGRDPRPLVIAGNEGRTYELGLEPPPDDIDGRMPAVVVWHEGPMHYLLASGELQVATLLEIAGSLYR
jgi:hypothetical protein